MQKPKAIGVAIFLSDKPDFMQKSVRRDKECHYILKKGAIQQEDTALLNTFAVNIGALNFIKHF
jgi:hypothetical protein